MKTLIPYKTFCNEEDKYDPTFILYDKDVPLLARSLYHRMFRFAGDKNYCAENQKTLAECLNTSVRTVQRLIRTLEQLEYIKIEKIRLSPQEPIVINHYYLLLSDRVLNFIKEANIAMNTEPE